MNHTPSFRALAAVLLSAALRRAAALLPLDHFAQPVPLWNQAIHSPLGDGNVVQISPDDRWLYVTSADGTLSRLDPAFGDFVAKYAPEPRGEGWLARGFGGISFHVDGRGGDGYLVYRVLDVPPAGEGPRSSSRVIAVRHGDAEEIEVLWTKVIDGSIVGTPLIGSEGKFIYFTMNSTPAPQVTDSPAASPVAAPVETDSPTESPVTNSPTKSPLTNFPTKSPVADDTGSALFTLPPSTSPDDTNDSDNSTESPPGKPEYWWAEGTEDGGTACVKNSNYPDTYVSSGIILNLLHETIEDCCEKHTEATCDNPQPESIRRLQQGGENSGYFVILSHPLDGEVVYQFNSRSLLSVQQHYFAAAEIARAPVEGNYNGGAGNANDVVVWGSLPGGTGEQMGDTLLFQLPRGFDASREPVDTGAFRVRALESVPWTTLTKPTFSASGLDLYFAISGNRITGWNSGQKFDVVANLGPKGLPGAIGIGHASKPIVMAQEDKMLLVTGPTDDVLSAVDTTGSPLWVRGNIGNRPFTTPKVSPDSEIVYFGKQNSVYAINLFDGSPRWGENGYSSSSSSNFVMRADISLSSTGEFLYYNGFGRTISAIRVAEVIPTESPTVSPTSTPSSFSSPPPSGSHVPSASLSPTFSDSPTVDPNAPSLSPTMTNRPSAPSSLRPSSSPSAASSNAPSLPPSTPIVGNPPPAKQVSKSPTTNRTANPTENPTANPTAPSVTPPSGPVDPSPSSPIDVPPAPAELPENSNNEKSSGLGQGAIIGIAVGGAVGLALLLGAIFYVCKKNNSDDGLDTDWNPDENVGGGDKDTPFSYGSDNEESRQQGGGKTGARFSRGRGDVESSNRSSGVESRQRGGGGTGTQFSYGGSDAENRHQGNLEW